MPPPGVEDGKHAGAVALPVLRHCWHSPCAPWGRSGSAFRLGSKLLISSESGAKGSSGLRNALQPGPKGKKNHVGHSDRHLWQFLWDKVDSSAWSELLPFLLLSTGQLVLVSPKYCPCTPVLLLVSFCFKLGGNVKPEVDGMRVWRRAKTAELPLELDPTAGLEGRVLESDVWN